MPQQAEILAQVTRRKIATKLPRNPKMSKPLNRPLSIEIAEQINSKPTDCFDNAYQAALLTGAIYVQGFLAFAGASVPVEYSWIELEDCLVDPTLSHLNNNAQQLYYFPAQRSTVKQLKAALEESQEDYPDDPPLPVYGAPPHEYYGDLMMGGQDYEVAYQEAEAKCRELQLKTSDP